MIIDAQVHAYERDHPGRPWAATLHGPPEVTGADMVAAMDAVGVHGALLVSPWTMYRFDPSYALSVHATYPNRFGVITPIDPRSEHAEEAVAAWAGTPGAVGVRLMLWDAAPGDATHPGVERVMAAAGRHRLPLCVLCWGKLPLIYELAGRHPDTQLIIDHLGLRQPFEPPVPAEPFADLEALLALARRPNVAVKITGATTLSQRPYPFEDLWGPLGAIFDAFGLERCMWGTDWTRATALVTYAEATNAFLVSERLSPTERDALMGATLQRIFNWAPTPGPAVGR